MNDLPTTAIRRLLHHLLLPCLVWLTSGLAAAQEPAPQATAPPNARPFLWRIDGGVPSYLFGTIHLPDARVQEQQAEVERALADSDAVFTELAMDNLMTPALAAAMRMPAGQSLRDVAPEALVQRVLQRLGVPAGADNAMLSMRPWVLGMQVMLKPKPGAGDPLDLQIYKDAKSAGKEVGGLETVEEQLAVFDGLGLEGEVHLLEQTLDLLDDYERRGLDLTEQMLLAYLAGDTPAMLTFFEQMNDEHGVWGRLSRTLLNDRNLRMAERIDRKLHTEPQRRFVFAVGAGHLIGATNIVDLLRARGYTVTRVPETAANLDEEIEQLQQEVERRQARIRELQARRAALTPARKKAG